MFILIVTFLIGLGIAYFAIQNTNPVTITLANYPLKNVPVYLLAIASFLIGLFVSWVISLADSLSSLLTIHGKEKTIKEDKKLIADLEEKIHVLELENAKFKGEITEPVEEKVVEQKEVKRPLFGHFFHRYT